MPLQNRVTPLGELVAAPARGLVYGNRGCLHDDAGRIRRRFAGRRWIACRLWFRGWHRAPLMQPGRFTELFFLDEDAHEVRRGTRPIRLTPTEYNLLHYLLVNAGKVVSKAQILDHVWRYDFNGDASVVETYVSYLRRKVDPAGEPPLIQTVRGFGYAIRLAES